MSRYRSSNEEKYLEDRMEKLQFFKKLKTHLSPDIFNEEELNYIDDEMKGHESWAFGGNFYIHFKPKSNIDFSDKKVFNKFKKRLDECRIKIKNPTSGYRESRDRINTSYSKFDDKGNRIDSYDDNYDDPNLKVVTDPLEYKGSRYHRGYNHYIIDNEHPKDPTPSDNFYYQGKDLEIHHGFRNYSGTDFSLWFKNSRSSSSEELSFLIMSGVSVNGVNATEYISQNWRTKAFDEPYVKDVLLEYFDATAVWYIDDFKYHGDEEYKYRKLDVDLNEITNKSK